LRTRRTPAAERAAAPVFFRAGKGALDALLERVRTPEEAKLAAATLERCAWRGAKKAANATRRLRKKGKTRRCARARADALRALSRAAASTSSAARLAG
jgi:hypothetical protein